MSSAISQYLQQLRFDWRLSILIRPVQKSAHILHIVVTEAFATLRHVIPCAISWWIKEKYRKDIISVSFPLTINKVKSNAQLFLHSPLNVKKNENCTPILFIHGDHSHPYTLHHLAQIAEKNHSGPIFSLYIPAIHHDSHFKEQVAFLGFIISVIENMIKEKGGIFNGILAAGHSKGAMLLAGYQFHSDAPSKILRSFAVAGPLKNEENCFTEPLKTIFETVCQKIEKYRERKFFQIIPKNDWTAPYKAMAVRPEEHCYLVPGMHLSGLYSRKTTKLFKKFLTFA